MSRQRLNTSPSGGKSEVLATLRNQGAIHTGLSILRLSMAVSEDWGGDDAEHGDPQFLEDLQAVVAELAGEDLVSGLDAATGEAIDLSEEQPTAANVILTGQGRVDSRHPRPRPRYLRG